MQGSGTRVLAVLFALLLVTSPVVGAATAGMSHVPETHTSVTDGELGVSTGSPTGTSERQRVPRTGPTGQSPPAETGSLGALANGTSTTTVRGYAGVQVSFPTVGADSPNVTIAPFPTTGDHHLPSVSPTVRISTTYRSPGSPTVSLPLSESLNTSEFDHLSVYRWGGDGTARGWRPVETTIDGQSRRANATVSSLGFFTVLNETAWNESTRIRRPETIDPEDPTAIYVGTDTGTIQKLSPESGETAWNRSLTGDGETAVAADPAGGVYAATNDTSEVSQFDWVDGSPSGQVEFQRDVHSLTTDGTGRVIAAATGDGGGNVSLVDAEAGYRPWTLIHFSQHASDYNVDAITVGADGGIYAALYFESRRDPTRVVRLNRTALNTPAAGGNDSRLTRWETTLDARYVNDLQQRGDSLFVATSTGIRSVDTSSGSTGWSETVDGRAAGIAVGSNGTSYAITQSDGETPPELLRFDPETGSISNRTTLPLHAQASITDLTIGADGTAYVGSQTDAVYDPDGAGNGTAGETGTASSLSQAQLRDAAPESTEPAISFSPSEDQATLGPSPGGQVNNSTISIQATQQQIAPGEDLTVQFSADAQTTATLRLATTDGQVLFQNSVTATTQPTQFTISGVPAGTYVATIEADGGDAD